MFFTLISLAVFVGTYFLNRRIIKKESFRGWDGTWAVGVIVALILISIPISIYNFKVRIAEYESRKETISQQRMKTSTEFERVMLSQEIIDDNAWLIKMQTTQDLKTFNWWVPKKIQTLTPIK